MGVSVVVVVVVVMPDAAAGAGAAGAAAAGCGCGGRVAAVGDGLVERLRLLDPAGHGRLRRDPPHRARPRRDELLERLRQVGRVAVRELRGGVHAGGLEQVRVLGADAVEPHEVDVVDPLEDQLARDPGGRLDPRPAARGRPALEQRLGGRDPGLDQLVRVDAVDALDVADLHLGLPPLPGEPRRHRTARFDPESTAGRTGPENASGRPGLTRRRGAAAPHGGRPARR